jgi:hypothetical protein
MDKRTKFWNAYKTLANEHDGEFKEQYSNDLNISLIFVGTIQLCAPVLLILNYILKAGLFSAVDSAFIIQIQPGIQPHGTPATIILAQSLLYISLGSTLLASLLAVTALRPSVVRP